MSLHPLVSVCMPCYNAEAYVLDAVQSILDQTYENLELIIVNDGSKDGSYDQLQSITDSRVTVIQQENQGQCAAANRAYEASKGEYIKFFDADDSLSPSYIEAQVKRLIEGDEDDIASASWGRFYEDDLNTFQLSTQDVWKDLPAQEWLVQSWEKARPMMQCALFLIPRHILEKTGGWNESLSLINDFEFFARVLTHCKTIRFTPEAVLYYRSGVSGTLSGQKSRTAVESAFHSLMWGVDHLLKVDDSQAAKLSCANVLQDFEYEYYPYHRDLRVQMVARVKELGGSSLPPDGPPRFHQLRKIMGWKLARRIQLFLGR